MSELRALSLSAFIPSGKDYEASRRFFADLGFEEVWENNGYAGFKLDDAQFILQKYDNDVFAQNLMMQLVVSDLDLWWATIARLKLEERYAGVRVKPPTDFPWGREVNLIDPAGVCWHVRQR